jgi:hypothetical protein
MQEYDFDVEHVDGELNVVADALSRSVLKRSREDEEVVSGDPSASEYSVPLVADKLTTFVERNTVDIEEPDPVIATLICAFENVRMSEDIRKLIGTVHNAEIGHHGVRRTLDLLRPRRWKNMQEHVAIFLSECPICQKQSERDIRAPGVPFTLSSTKPQ